MLTSLHEMLTVVYQMITPAGKNPHATLYGLQAMTCGLTAMMSLSLESRRLCICHVFSALIYFGLALLYLYVH